MKIISQAALYTTFALSSLHATSSVANASGEAFSPVRSPRHLVEGAFAVPPAPHNSPASHLATPVSSAIGLTPILKRYAPGYTEVGPGCSSFTPALGGSGTSEVAAASSSSAIGLTAMLERYAPGYAEVGLGRGSFTPRFGGAGASEILAGSSVKASLLSSFDAAATSNPYGLRTRKFTDYAKLNSGER